MIDMRIKTKQPITLDKIQYPANTIFDAGWLFHIENGVAKSNFDRILIGIGNKRYEIRRDEVEMVYKL